MTKVSLTLIVLSTAAGAVFNVTMNNKPAEKSSVNTLVTIKSGQTKLPDEPARGRACAQPQLRCLLRPPTDEIIKHNNEGVGKLNAGDERGALDEFDQALAKCPTYSFARKNKAVLFNNQGVSLGKAGDYKASLVKFDQAIATDPDCALHYENRAKVRGHLGDAVGALADLREYARLSKRSEDAGICGH